MNHIHAVFFLFAAVLLGSDSPLSLLFVSASLPCNNTGFCESKYRKGSKCVNNACSNPFESGCLRSVLGENATFQIKSSHQNRVLPLTKRICNSDDSEDVVSKGDVCILSPLDYNELRVAFDVWPSPQFLSWIIQIFLSEILQVPVSIDTGGEGGPQGSASFYDPENNYVFASSAYYYPGLEKANAVGDCREVDLKTVGCFHYHPEVWPGQMQEVHQAVKEGYILPPKPSGVVGGYDFYVPFHTVMRDNTLSSYLGLQGEQNRRKLAETFLAPTTWRDYCNDVSSNNCTTDDGVAKRAPETQAEEAQYHDEENYVGHFRNTTQNDCDNNPECTGHIVDPPCSWSKYTVQQLSYNNVFLSSDGPEGNSNSYSYSAIQQIIRAAFATQSDVMTVWYKPEPLLEQFDLIPVSFPRSTAICEENRASVEERCSSNITIQKGNMEGSCGYEVSDLNKLFASVLLEEYQRASDGSRSPAFQVLTDLRISKNDISSIFHKWVSRGIDPDGFDQREAVCNWVASNLDDLLRVVPSGYPRTLLTSTDSLQNLKYAALSISSVVTVAVLTTAALTHHWKEEKSIKAAQINFLNLILLGYFFLSIGSILRSLDASAGICLAEEWMETLGLALAYIPLVVKVKAVTVIDREARHYRRATISQGKLYRVVGAFTGFVIIFLIVLSVVDTPTLVETFNLRGENTVLLERSCSFPQELIFTSIQAGFEGLIVIFTLLYAFDARNVRAEFNESQSLAFLAYSHFIWAVARNVITFVDFNFPSQKTDDIISIIISADTISGLMIYFFPKFLGVKKTQHGNKPPVNFRTEKENKFLRTFLRR